MHTCQPIVRYWPLAAHGQRQLWVGNRHVDRHACLLRQSLAARVR